MDRIPERLRTAAEGVAKATQMMAVAKSERNGDGACYSGLKREETAEWKGAVMIEKYEAAMDAAMQRLNESGTGEMGLVDTIHAVHQILRAAR